MIYIYHETSILSLYIFIEREEIQRIKAANPEIPHREAFSTAAKNVSSTLTFSSHTYNMDVPF